MNTRPVKPFTIACAVSLCIASAGHAAMYKWTAADGHVTFSNQPPSDMTGVKDLTRIEDPKERAGAAAAEPEKRGAENATLRPQPVQAPAHPAARLEHAPARPDVPAARAEPVRGHAPIAPAATRPEPSLARPGAAPLGLEASPRADRAPPARDAALNRRDGDAAGAPSRRVETEAVRDPCLRSPDPRCHERHRHRYHPYFGYAPSVTQGSAPAVGATATGAGGTLSGQVGVPVPPAPAIAPRRAETSSPITDVAGGR